MKNKEAIELLKRATMFEPTLENRDYPDALDLAIKALEEERPQGEWVFIKANEEQTDGYECSVCKTTYHTRVPYFSEFNFCPNCGADMRGEEE